MLNTARLLILFSALGLMSCAPQKGEPLSQASAPAVLSQALNVLAQLPRGDRLPPLPSDSPDCANVSPTGLALTHTYSYACTEQTLSATRVTRIGSLTVQDLDDREGLSLLGRARVDFNLDHFDSIDLASMRVSKNSGYGFWEFKPDTLGGLMSTADFRGHAYRDGSAHGLYDDFDFSYTWNWGLVPQQTADPFLLGSISFDGTFKLDGSFITKVGGNTSESSGKYSLKFISQDLKFDRVSCGGPNGKYFSSGSIIFDDQGGNKMEIRYACTSAAFYLTAWLRIGSHHESRPAPSNLNSA